MTSSTLLRITGRIVFAVAVAVVLTPSGVAAQSEPKISLTPSELTWLSEHPTIRLGVDPDAAPMEFVGTDGKYAGVASDVVRLVSERLGINLVVQKGLTWTQVLDKAKTREVDVLPCVARTREREDYLLFTQPYANVPVVILTRIDAPYIESLDDLRGKTVAVVKGYQLHERMKIEKPGLKLLVVNSTKEALQAVSDAKAFAFPGNLAQTFGLLPKLGISNLKVAAPTAYSYAPCLGIRHDWPEFRDILDKALAAISPEERTAISQKWASTEKLFGLDYSIVLKWLAIGAAVIAVLFLWNVQIRRQKRIVKESEQRLQTIMDSIPNVVFVTDMLGRKVLVNSEWERVTKHTRREAIGKTYEELYPAGLAEKLAANDRKVVETESPLSTEETVRTRDGSRTYVQSLLPLADLSGKLYAVCGSATDITARKCAEEQLQKSLTESQRLLAEAARYVKALLPEPVSRGDIIVDWRFEPCADLGGDCFGYHWLDRDHFALYLIDVSGHGVSASLLAVTILNLLRSQTLKDTDFHSPGNVLSSLNRAFPMEEHNGMYFTIWYGIYHASSRRLTYSSGGHPPALLIGPDTDNRQTPTHLQTPNLFIGGLPDVQYNEGSVMFTGPSRVYVFSDGVFEIEEGENCPWGYKNFTCFAALHAQSQGSFLDELMIRVGIMRDGRSLADDFSIVEARFL